MRVSNFSFFSFFSSFLTRTPRTVKKEVAFYSHKNQGNKFSKDRVMIAAKTKPKLERSSGKLISRFLGVKCPAEK